MSLVEELEAERDALMAQIKLLRAELEAERQNRVMFARQWREQKLRADGLESELSWDRGRVVGEWIG